MFNHLATSQEMVKSIIDRKNIFSNGTGSVKRGSDIGCFRSLQYAFVCRRNYFTTFFLSWPRRVPKVFYLSNWYIVSCDKFSLLKHASRLTKLMCSCFDLLD